MKKNLLNWMLLAALMLGFSTGVTSCSDDDDKNNEQRNEDADPLDTDEARTAFRWLCALTDVQTLADNWSAKTYEPTVGEPSENNANTRLVVVKSLDEARLKFSSLAGVSPDQLSTEVTVSQAGVGKLVWTPSKQGAQNLAEVSVDTKLIPHLQKIIYCTSEQTGLNGLFGVDFAGTAYYRLGDVVQDAQGYYWVCVRPSFERNKGKSHWINIFNAGEYGKFNGQTVPIPRENIKDKWNKRWAGPNTTIILPTKLKFNREHLFNLSNLIWALLNPEAYTNKVDGKNNPNAPGLCGFEYKFHGEKFLTRVSDFWEEEGIWQKLFGHNRMDMKKLSGMNFFYQGYSWTRGDYATLWRYRSTDYEKTISGSDSKDETTYNMNVGFDITRYAHDPNADRSVGPSEFGTVKTELYDDLMEGYWVVRYKTGADLFSNYHYFEEMTNCTTIYNYNQKTGKDVRTDIEEENEISLDNNLPLTAPVVGCIVGSDGQFYKNLKVAQKQKVQPEAVVVYVGNKFAESNRVYPGAENWRYNGLAMKLNDGYPPVTFIHEMASDMICYQRLSDPDYWEQMRNGLAVQQILNNGGCNEDTKLGYSHKALHNFTSYSDDNWPKKTGANADKFSEWFTPSVGQWILALKSFGFSWTPRTTINGREHSFGNGEVGGKKWYDVVNTQAGQKFLSIRYATCSEYSEKEYINIIIEDNTARFVINDKKSTNILARRALFCAFVYGEGATDDSDLTDYSGE